MFIIWWFVGEFKLIHNFFCLLQMDELLFYNFGSFQVIFLSQTLYGLRLIFVQLPVACPPCKNPSDSLLNQNVCLILQSY